MIAPTIHGNDATKIDWDAIIVGAGLAGAATAIGLSRQGYHVLLVDRKTFPREKVCGACLNLDAVAGLKWLGVDDHLRRAGAVSLDGYQLKTKGRDLQLALPGGLAISRRTMDAILVEQAIDAGCEFLSGTDLKMDTSEDTRATPEFRSLVDRSSARFRGRVVVVATGLGNEFRMGDPNAEFIHAPNSLIGMGSTTMDYPESYVEGTIFMAVGTHGYVGLTRIEDDQLNLAAAIDPRWLKGHSAADRCKEILQQAGFPTSAAMLGGPWRGTTSLTRKRPVVALPRVFFVGDAAGYVEPFTGEGMSWAIRGGRALTAIASQAIDRWDPRLIDQWTTSMDHLVRQQQGWCRALAMVLRHPRLAGSLVRLVAAAPSIGQFVVRQINKERKHDVFDHRTGNRPAA